MKKSIVAGVLIAGLSISSVSAGGPNIFINDEYLEVKAITIEGRTMVPVATISKQLGIDYTWDNTTQTVTFKQEDKELSLKVGEQNSFVKNGRTYVPLRFIAEKFGIEVDWRADSKTVVIGEDAKTIEIKPIKEVEEPEESKAYNELTGFKRTPIDEVNFLKNADFRLDNRDEWGKAENIENVYFLAKKDLPIKLGNVVITDIVIDKCLYKLDRILLSGYVLEDEMGLATVQTGLIDFNNRYRSRTFFSFNQEFHNYLVKKYPNLKGLYENEKNLITSLKGEKFTYITRIDPAGSELDYGSFKTKDINKITLYSYKYGKDIIVFDPIK